jgi:cell fate (sporulation/competence/biofilm development) regulator YlbF (YheA/YmcA/DUF963 family)
MEDILELASKLGKRIASNDRATAFTKARQALEANLEARQLLADYEESQHKIAELEATGKPLEPDDKRKMADLHSKVVGNEVLKDLLKTQTDFLQMMTLVSQKIESEAIGSG